MAVLQENQIKILDPLFCRKECLSAEFFDQSLLNDKIMEIDAPIDVVINRLQALIRPNSGNYEGRLRWEYQNGYPEDAPYPFDGQIWQNQFELHSKRLTSELDVPVLFGSIYSENSNETILHIQLKQRMKVKPLLLFISIVSTSFVISVLSMAISFNERNLSKEFLESVLLTSDQLSALAYGGPFFTIVLVGFNILRQSFLIGIGDAALDRQLTLLKEELTGKKYSFQKPVLEPYRHDYEIQTNSPNREPAEILLDFLEYEYQAHFTQYFTADINYEIEYSTTPKGIIIKTVRDHFHRAIPVTTVRWEADRLFLHFSLSQTMIATIVFSIVALAAWIGLSFAEDPTVAIYSIIPFLAFIRALIALKQYAKNRKKEMERIVYVFQQQFQKEDSSVEA